MVKSNSSSTDKISTNADVTEENSPDTCTDQFDGGPRMQRKNSYNQMDLFCPECNEYLDISDTIYVRGEPKICRTCEARIEFGCKHCKKMFKSRCESQRHIKWVCGKLPGIACPHCSYKTYYSYCLKKHLFYKHTASKYTCKKCSNCDKSVKDMYQHSMICSGQKSAYFTCKMCRKNFKSKMRHDKHVKFYCLLRKK